MRKLLSSMVVVAVAIAPALVSAQVPVVTPAPASAVTDKGKSRVICRNLDTTGSRLAKKKDCRTAAEWEELRANYRMDVERIQFNRGTIGG